MFVCVIAYMETQQNTIEKIRIRAEVMLANAQLNDVRVQVVDQVGDWLGKSLAQSMKLFVADGHVWGEQVDGGTVRYPADWWQAVRERFLPARWLKRHPVKYITGELRAEVIYPRLAAPKEQTVIRLYKHESNPKELV